MFRRQDMSRYTTVSIYLHWIIAVLMLGLLSVSFFLEDLSSTIKPTGIMLHKSFGLTVLWLMVLRLCWLVRFGRPSLPASLPCWERALAAVVQNAMYILLLAMPLSGWLMSTLSQHTPRYFGLFPLPFPGLQPNQAWADIFFQAHEIMAWSLIALIALHTAGAVKHMICDKDTIMDTMLP